MLISSQRPFKIVGELYKRGELLNYQGAISTRPNKSVAQVWNKCLFPTYYLQQIIMLKYSFIKDEKLTIKQGGDELVCFSSSQADLLHTKGQHLICF